MFNIVDPVTEQKYNIFQYKGRNILKKYIISYKNGGDCSIDKKTSRRKSWSDHQTCLENKDSIDKARNRKIRRGNMINLIIENIEGNEELQTIGTELGLKIDVNDVGSDKLTSDKDINLSFEISNINNLKVGLNKLPELYNKLVDIINNNITTGASGWLEEGKYDSKEELPEPYQFMSEILDVNFYFPTTLFKFSNLEGINKKYYLTFEKKDDISTIFFIPIIKDDNNKFRNNEFKKMIINESIFNSKKCLDIEGYNDSFTTNKTGGDNECKNIDNIYNDYEDSIGTCVKNLFDIALNSTGDDWNENFYCTQNYLHL